MNGVSGVGSVQSPEVGPAHVRHALSHAAQLLTPRSLFRCMPLGQREKQRLASQMGLIPAGQLASVQFEASQRVHWCEPGPEHSSQEPWQGSTWPISST